MISIDDLPNEIWLLVIGYLGIESCIALGKASCFLNALVVSTPPFSDRFKNHDGVVHVTISCLRRHRSVTASTAGGGIDVDDLDILSAVSSVSKIERLKFTLDSPCNLKYHFLAPDYNRLTSCIQHLSPSTTNPSHISIELEQPSLSPRTNSPSRLTSPNLHIHGWITSLSNLLNACISKGITSFEVSRGHFPKDSFVPFIDFTWSPSDLWCLVQRIPAVKKRLVFNEDVTRRGLGWYLSPVCGGVGVWPVPKLKLRTLRLRVGDTGSLGHGEKEKERERAVQPKLRKFTIGTALLLLPPFSNWTYQLLATSPSLTTLVIQNIHHMSSHHWRIAMCWLGDALRIQNGSRSLGSLRSLTIRGCRELEVEVMIYFVKRFRRTLVELTLGCEWEVVRVQSTSTWGVGGASTSLHGRYNDKVDLPKLAFIRATWPILVRLAEVDRNGRVEHTLKLERKVVEALRERFRALKEIVVDWDDQTSSSFCVGDQD